MRKGIDMPTARRGGSNVYPQSMFRAKILQIFNFHNFRKICILNGSVFVMQRWHFKTMHVDQVLITDRYVIFTDNNVINYSLIKNPVQHFLINRGENIGMLISSTSCIICLSYGD